MIATRRKPTGRKSVAKKPLLLSFFLMLLSVLLFNNCSGQFSPLRSILDSESVIILTACQSRQFKIYEQTVQPFVSKCALCHSGKVGIGMSQAAFASPSSITGFQWFMTVGTTKLRAYGSNFEHGAGAGGPQNQNSLDAIEEAFIKVSDEAVCKNSGEAGLTPHKTNAQMIGSITTTNKTLKWILGTEVEAGPTDFGGATFEIQIKKGAMGPSGQSYYISSPIIKTAGSGIEVKELFVYINGLRLDFGTTFSEIDRFIPAGNVNSPLATSAIIVDMAQGNRGNIKTSDTIAITFGHLATSTGTGPSPTPGPTPTPGPPNGPTLYANNCQSCHGSLATSTRRGRTAAQIQNAIETRPSMMNIVLSVAEIQAIATALQ